MKKLIYDNPLACGKDVEGFVLEGQAQIAFEDGRMHLISTADPDLGQAANYVFWCPENFPADVEITWEFQPLNDVGLCIFFFAALGKNGEDIFDERLAKRTGQYQLYHSGDINAFHISYYRRRYPEERVFRTCNLRKSYGFHLTAIAGDPIPEAASATKAYQMKVVKKANVVDFFIDDLPVLHFEDDGETYGKLLQGGKVGFRRRKRLTQKALAELVGVDRSHVSAIELGNVGVSFDLIFKLCEVLEVAPKQLFDIGE